MNLPIFLTLLRILFIPGLVVALLTEFTGKELTAFIIFVLAALTDSLDGIVARRKKQITAMGKLLDPIADKLLIASAFICLVQLGAVPAWMVVIILGREIAVTGFRAIASSRGVIISASRIAKLKMLFESITIGLLILGEKYLGSFSILAQIGLWIVIATAWTSAVEYYIKYGPLILSKETLE
jgi:CDP-diacylglycerol--glycerol-3-phosphate 3-phosphatidyltransferase